MTTSQLRHIDDENTDNSFAQFALPSALMTTLLKMQYNTPTPIQEKAIPVALTGQDILGSARTGTGKTAAFSIPMIARLMTEENSAALIMSPTRELATQIYAVVDLMLGGRGGGTGIRTALLIGGESMGRQFDQLRAKPRIIIGTPGRINDHLRRNPSMFKTTNILVLDEADRMLDMGFAPQIDEIIRTMPKQRQTLMFSATFADSILKFAHSYLNKPERISVDPISVSAVNIKHEVVETTDGRKYEDLLAELEAREGSVIIFVRTKHGADRLAKRLGDHHATCVIHGGLRQNQRDRAILAFRNKKTRVMVATDVAARGLDVPHIEHVINYDLPQCTEDYIHRVGRTARAGAQGSALCMITPSDRSKWNEIQRLLDGKKGARPQQNRSNGGGQKRNDSYNKPRGEGRSLNGEGRGFGDKPRSEGRDYSNASRKKEGRGGFGDKKFAPRDDKREDKAAFGADGEGRNRFYKKADPRPAGDKKDFGKRDYNAGPRKSEGRDEGKSFGNRNDRGPRDGKSHSEHSGKRDYAKPAPRGNDDDRVYGKPSYRPDYANKNAGKGGERNHGDRADRAPRKFGEGKPFGERSDRAPRENRDFAHKGPRKDGEGKSYAPREGAENRGRDFDRSNGPRKPHGEGKPFGERNDRAPRENPDFAHKSPRKDDEGFQKRDARGDKPAFREGKPEGKKPFQFKAHSRKPSRGQGGGKPGGYQGKGGARKAG